VSKRSINSFAENLCQSLQIKKEIEKELCRTPAMTYQNSTATVKLKTAMKENKWSIGKISTRNNFVVVFCKSFTPRPLADVPVSSESYFYTQVSA
jgi:hypothetical protein